MECNGSFDKGLSNFPSVLFASSLAREVEHLVVGSNPLVRDPLLPGDDRAGSVLHFFQRVQARLVQVLPDEETSGVAGHDDVDVRKDGGAADHT